MTPTHTEWLGNEQYGYIDYEKDPEVAEVLDGSSPAISTRTIPPQVVVTLSSASRVRGGMESRIWVTRARSTSSTSPQGEPHPRRGEGAELTRRAAEDRQREIETRRGAGGLEADSRARPRAARRARGRHGERVVWRTSDIRCERPPCSSSPHRSRRPRPRRRRPRPCSARGLRGARAAARPGADRRPGRARARLPRETALEAMLRALEVGSTAVGPIGAVPGPLPGSVREPLRPRRRGRSSAVAAASTTSQVPLAVRAADPRHADTAADVEACWVAGRAG